jgi:hypothetical protein
MKLHACRENSARFRTDIIEIWYKSSSRNIKKCAMFLVDLLNLVVENIAKKNIFGLLLSSSTKGETVKIDTVSMCQ